MLAGRPELRDRGLMLHRPVALVKAVETLLREGLGRVGEADVAEPRMPTSAAEIDALS